MFFFLFHFDWQIKFFTAEAGLFKRHLKYFKEIENIRINQQIVNLLIDIHGYIKDSLENLERMEMPDQDIVKLIFEFDERQYSLRRHLECHSCCVSIVSVGRLN